MTQNKSWKTTTAAIAGAVAILAAALSAALDGDPATVVQTEQVLAAVATILGLFGVAWFAQDDQKKGSDD